MSDLEVTNSKSLKTKRHIAFPSIIQYRAALSNIQKYYRKHPEAPRNITFIGTVKMHGTNAGLCYNEKDGLWCQSRANIIDLTYDNAGFAFHIHKFKGVLDTIFRDCSEHFRIDTNTNTLVLYGEWCGGNIQKGVALCDLPKMFVIFGLKCSPHTTESKESKDEEDPAQGSHGC